MSDLSQLRDDMVENQIAARSIRSEAVLGALRKVPREAFLPSVCANSPMRIAASHSCRADHLPALYRGADDGGAGIERRRKGARNQDGLRLCSGRAGRDRSGSPYDRAHQRACRKGGVDAGCSWVPQRPCDPCRWDPWLGGGGAI